jgi:hypothetical protein
VREGWVRLLNSTQLHYFKGSGRHALCGKLMLLKLWVQPSDRPDSPGDCASCRRWLRSIENEHNQPQRPADSTLVRLDQKNPVKKIASR